MVRAEVAPWDKDRYMSPDISKVKNILREEKIWNAVKIHMENYHRSQVNIKINFKICFRSLHFAEL